MVKPTAVYPYQFQMYLGELLEQNANYKVNVIDRQVKLDQRRKDLDIAKADLDQSGLHAQFRLKVVEKDVESLNIAKSTLSAQKDAIRYRIEPLLEKILSWFDDIKGDFESGQLSTDQFKSYLRSYANILDAGNTLGLECYQKYTVVSRINLAIEKYAVEPVIR
jgi:molecular chaperone GrpE (heat shock protein)